MSDKPNYYQETGVAWAMAAKNALKNVYRFSPNQLVFWKKTTSLRDYQRMHLCRLHLIDWLTLSEIKQNPENKEERNSYDSKEIWVSGNNEQYVSTEMDTHEFDKASIQTEPDNSNAEQPDDTYDESLPDNTILLKVKDRVVLLGKVEMNGNIEQFILELVKRLA